MSNTPIRDMPNFGNYGWKLIDNKTQPIMTNGALIPSDLSCRTNALRMQNKMWNEPLSIL